MARWSDSKRGIAYEKKAARKHNARHVGGPGNPDYVRGDTWGEVKNWNRPVDGGTMEDLIDNGIDEVVSRNGFTEPAIEVAKDFGVKLFDGERHVSGT